MNSEGFEYDDFKINFYVSPILTIRKCYNFSKLEHRALGKYSDSCFPTLYTANHIDFKEIFKWVTCTYITDKLGVKANLDGKFQINVKYSDKEREDVLLAELKKLKDQTKPIKNNNRKKRE